MITKSEVNIKNLQDEDRMLRKKIKRSNLHENAFKQCMYTNIEMQTLKQIRIQYNRLIRQQSRLVRRTISTPCKC